MTKLPQLNKKLFTQAFTHRSYLNETKENVSSNERMEFLGDSIISFVVSQYLYNKYPEFDEGQLTNLRSLMVNTESLAQVSKELGFGEFLKLSRGEEQLKGRENTSLLADSFEAFVGALFIDQGLLEITKFLDEVLLFKAAELVTKDSLKDSKSLLQEFVQSKGQMSPFYKVINEEGPAHQKLFTVEVYTDATLLGKGKGKSKQEAEKDAAENALLTLSKSHK